MLGWKKKHHDARRLALTLLKSPEAKGKVYMMEAFSLVMNNAMSRAEADGGKNLPKFTGDMLRNAFSVGGATIYTTEIEGCNDVAYIGIGIQAEQNSARISFIGRVKNKEAGDEQEPIERIGSLSLNKWNRISQKMLTELKSYLSNQKPPKKRKSEVALDREASRRQKRRSDEDIEAEREAKRQKQYQLELDKAEKNVLSKAEDLKKAVAALQMAEDGFRRLRDSQTTLGSQSTRPSPMSNYSSDPNDKPIKLDSTRMLRYIWKGRAGEMLLPEKRKVVLVDELQLDDNFTSLPDGHDTEEANAIREKRGYHVSNFGANQGWTPNGASSNASNKMSILEDDHAIVTAIRDLFKKKKCTFKDESLKYLAAFTSNACGASDEDIMMAAAGMMKCFFNEVGLDDISARDIANCLPSPTKIRDLELNLAADCLATRLFEIMEDNARSFALVTDHGKRAGMEHFVKLLCWFGKDKEGNETLKFHCIDVDSSNHTGRDCAKAIKKSLEIFTGQEGLEVTCVSGDSGGGAAVQTLLPHLKRLRAVSLECSKINCQLHALNKCLETSLQDVLGLQGIGRRTPFQLLFVFNQLWKRIREEGGGDYLDEIFAITMQELTTNEAWKNEAENNFPQAYNELRKKFEELESMEDDAGIDELVAMLTERPKGLVDPVFSRWQTVAKSAKVVVEHWVIIYFIAVAVKQDAESGSYLWQLACTLLSLMNTCAEPSNDEDGETIDEMIESFNPENTPEGYDLPPTKEKTPTFYAMLLWVQGFTECYFDDMFEWMMRSDPELGNGSWGQSARLAVERCYVMHMKLSELENDGWKDKPEFKPYLDALEKIPYAGDVNNAGKEFFNKMPSKILRKFRQVFQKHVFPCWTSNDILHYIIGGNPTLARHFAAMLVHYKTNLPTSNDDNNDDDDDIDVSPYEFPDEDITLDRHKVRNGDVVVNVRECMSYLTKYADLDYIMKRPFVQNHWEHIERLGTSEDDVDIFDDEEDYTPLKEAVFKEISIHSVHQQRCENYVQVSPCSFVAIKLSS
jgi:hypothetical protein